MDLKLRDRKDGVGNALDCVTIDSFARSIVVRWQSLAHHLGLRATAGDFLSITSAAGVLVQRPHVARWVARRYPVVVVDEMQDAKGGEVDLLRGLEPYVHLLGAADGFQDLTGEDDEVLSWAEEVGEVVPLTKVRRTEAPGLLAAATAIREGWSVPSDPKAGFEIVYAAAAAQAGAIVCWRLRSWTRHGPIALISATARGTSPFCDQLLEWVSTKTSTSKKSGQTAGPYAIEWESGDDEVRHALLARLGLADAPTAPLSCTDVEAAAVKGDVPEMRDWARRQRFVVGTSTVTLADVTQAASEIVRRRRTFGREQQWKRRAMTIYQAKNREFESVVILWPLRLAGGVEQKRRLLYNAVTRARGRAVVIVQDSKATVAGSPLFTGDRSVDEERHRS